MIDLCRDHGRGSSVEKEGDQVSIHVCYLCGRPMPSQLDARSMQQLVPCRLNEHGRGGPGSGRCIENGQAPDVHV